MRTNKELITSITTNLHYHYMFDPREHRDNNTQFHLSEIKKIDKWLTEDYEASNLPDYEVRYVSENCGWSFLVQVLKDNEWVTIYDHSRLSLETPEWLK